MAHGSILTIIGITFERYYAICKPLKAGYKCTRKRALLIILVIWIIAVTSTTPMLSITELQEVEYIDGDLVTVCINSLQGGWHLTYYISVFLVFFCSPFLLLVILYIIIAKRLVVDSKRIVNCTQDSRQIQVRRQVVLMMASVCLIFFICLLPFRLMTLWIIFSSPEDIQQLGMEPYYCLLYFCRIMLYINSSVNPLIYNLISSKFRAGFSKILNIRLCKQRYHIKSSFYTSKSGSVVIMKGDSQLSRINEYNHSRTTTSTNHHPLLSANSSLVLFNYNSTNKDTSPITTL